MLFIKYKYDRNMKGIIFLVNLKSILLKGGVIR